MPSWTNPEAYLLGDSNSSQVDSEDKWSQTSKQASKQANKQQKSSCLIIQVVGLKNATL